MLTAVLCPATGITRRTSAKAQARVGTLRVGIRRERENSIHVGFGTGYETIHTDNTINSHESTEGRCDLIELHAEKGERQELVTCSKGSLPASASIQPAFGQAGVGLGSLGCVAAGEDEEMIGKGTEARGGERRLSVCGVLRMNGCCDGGVVARVGREERETMTMGARRKCGGAGRYLARRADEWGKREDGGGEEVVRFPCRSSAKPVLTRSRWARRACRRRRRPRWAGR